MEETGKKSFSYSTLDKAAFYLSYFTSKFISLWFEVKRPKLKMFVYEALYSAMKFIDRESLFPSPFETDYVETKYGRFSIRPRTVDMSNVSPGFERRDISYLLRLLGRLMHEGKGILFLDIGSDIGTFAITVGNRLKNYARGSVIAFEPAPSSFAVLKENVRLNGLEEKVELHNAALFSEDGRELPFFFNVSAPGSSGIADSGETKVLTRTLDAVLGGDYLRFDAIVLKLDVEGVETDVLKGSQMLLESGKEVWLLVEDFVNPAIVSYLEEKGASFVAKLTPYNSWWRYGKTP